MFSRWFFPDVLPTEALFAELALAGLVVIIAGVRLTRLADSLATALNLGSGWVGLILLATVTSLPELVAGGTATAIGNFELAMGGILGSCSFNITLIVLLNAFQGGGSVLRGVSPSHTLTCLFGLVLIGLALFGVVLQEKFGASAGFASVCEVTWAGVIFVAYLGCMRLIYCFERSNNSMSGDGTACKKVKPAIYMGLVAAAVVIMAASWWLAKLGDILSDHEIQALGRPLGATFVGACFLALATSLPEIVTSITAVRLGNLDLALGNIFGSNMFNIFVIPLLKVVSLVRGDALLMEGATFNGTQSMIMGLTAILLTAIAMGGLVYQTERRLLRRFGVDSVLIAVVYLGGMILLLMEG